MAIGGGGAGGGGGAIRAGAAFVELFTDSTKLEAGLKTAGHKVAGFGAAMAKAGAVALGGAGGLVAGVGFKALETLGDTAKLGAAADAFGLSATAASRLFGIMRSAGSDTRDAVEGIVTLGQRVTDALSGTGKEAAELFQGLNVGAEQFAGLAPDQQFYKLLDSLNKVADPAKRVQLLLKAVGEDTGKNLIPLLGQSAAEVQELGRLFEVGAGDMKRAKDATAAYTKATALLQRAWLEVATALAPTLGQVAGWVSAVAQPVGEFIRQNRLLIVGGFALAGAVAAAGAAFVGIGTVLALAGVALGGIAAVVGAVLSPFGLAAAAVTAFGLVLFTQTDVFDGFLSGFMRTFDGVRDALSAGDLALAGRVAMAGLNLAWQEGIDVLSRAWRSFSRTITDVMATAFFQVKNTYRDLTTGVAATLIDVLNSVGVYSDKEAKGMLKGLWKENESLQRKATAEQARIRGETAAARAAEDAALADAGNPALIAARMAAAFANARAAAARKAAEKPDAKEEQRARLAVPTAALSKSVGAFLGGSDPSLIFNQGVDVQKQQLTTQREIRTGIDKLGKAVDTLPVELARLQPKFA